MSILDSKIPEGPLAEKWNKHKAKIKVVSPANKRKLEIIVVGTGLGGASAAASLAELGYKVKAFCYQDSPRGRIPSLHRAVLMRLKTIKTTTTRFSGCFTIPSKEVTTAHAKPMFTVWPKYLPTSSTSAWHRESRLAANTAGCSPTAHLAGCWFHVLFMPGTNRTTIAHWRLPGTEPPDFARKCGNVQSPRNARRG